MSKTTKEFKQWRARPDVAFLLRRLHEETVARAFQCEIYRIQAKELRACYGQKDEEIKRVMQVLDDAKVCTGSVSKMILSPSERVTALANNVQQMHEESTHAVTVEDSYIDTLLDSAGVPNLKSQVLADPDHIVVSWRERVDRVELLVNEVRALRILRGQVAEAPPQTAVVVTDGDNWKLCECECKDG